MVLELLDALPVELLDALPVELLDALPVELLDALPVEPDPVEPPTEDAELLAPPLEDAPAVLEPVEDDAATDEAAPLDDDAAVLDPAALLEDAAAAAAVEEVAAAELEREVLLALPPELLPVLGAPLPLELAAAVVAVEEEPVLAAAVEEVATVLEVAPVVAEEDEEEAAAAAEEDLVLPVDFPLEELFDDDELATEEEDIEELLEVLDVVDVLDVLGPPVDVEPVAVVEVAVEEVVAVAVDDVAVEETLPPVEEVLLVDEAAPVDDVALVATVDVEIVEVLEVVAAPVVEVRDDVFPDGDLPTTSRWSSPCPSSRSLSTPWSRWSCWSRRAAPGRRRSQAFDEAAAVEAAAFYRRGGQSRAHRVDVGAGEPVELRYSRPWDPEAPDEPLVRELAEPVAAALAPVEVAAEDDAEREIEPELLRFELVAGPTVTVCVETNGVERRPRRSRRRTECSRVAVPWAVPVAVTPLSVCAIPGVKVNVAWLEGMLRVSPVPVPVTATWSVAVPAFSTLTEMGVATPRARLEGAVMVAVSGCWTVYVAEPERAADPRAAVRVWAPTGVLPGTTALISVSLKNWVFRALPSS